MVETAPIAACVFDAYGTLFDVHAAMAVHAGRIGPDYAVVSALWRSKQLQYTWLRSLMGRHEDFAQVTAEALDFALERYQINDLALRDDLLAAYLQLDCFADVRPVLTELRGRGLRLAILSNGSPALLDAVVRHNHLADFFEGVWSVEEVGIYKPDPRVYALASKHFALPANQIAFVSSNGWDACGAAACGLRVAWVNRGGDPAERLPHQPEVTLAALAELPAWLAAAR